MELGCGPLKVGEVCEMVGGGVGVDWALIALGVALGCAVISVLCIVCANDDWDDKDPLRYGSDDDLPL